MPRPGPGKTVRVRVEFTKEHDCYLFKYLAIHHPSKAGRSGNKPFEQLIADKNGHWPWSVHHTWQSWRERYVRNADHFDRLILNYQRKHNIDSKPVDKRKRAAEPMPIEMLRQSAKRVRREEEEEEKEEEEGPPSGETRATTSTQHENASSSRPKTTPKPIPKRPPETPPQPTRKPEPTNARRTVPTASSPRSNANAGASATEKPTPALQTRHEVLEIFSSPPVRHATPPTDGKPEPCSPSRPVKRIKVRLGTPSDVFASDPSSPRSDTGADVRAGGPSSQTRPAPSTPSMGTDGALVATPVYPRAPPRVVDSLHGQVLVDREGHVPRALLHGGEDKGEEEEQDKARWPPARGHTAKLGGVEVKAHHPFSQPQSQPRPEAPRESVATGEREGGKPNQPVGSDSRTLDGALLDRRTVVARFSGHAVAPQVESGDMIRDGASPVKRVVATAPPPPSGPSKVLKFPAPRASTRSPFRPEPPAEETRHLPPPPQPQRQSPTRAARHPALTRIRRQTMGHGHGNGHEHEHRREHGSGQVPSVDLVALSHSSMSARSHSRSSASASVHERRPRWSLPAFAHATPWVFDEPDGAPLAPGSALASSSSSGSGSLFRWAAPSAVYSDWGHGRARTSTPRFMWTPSPARSVAATTHANGSGSGPAPRANGTPTSPSPTIPPHPADVHLTAMHGLASILAHMSANHGLAPGVVEAVYARVGSLREADEVLRGMREAAEGFGEREIERRGRGRGRGVGRGERAEERQGRGDRDEGGRGRLRYVVASEDGEGSEYSPPETSRAAMWKRQSESSSYVEEGEEEEKEEEKKEAEEDEDEEAEEGRAVEEELRDLDEHEDDGENHDFSRHVPSAEEIAEEDGWDEEMVTEALLHDMRLAQELERQVGKGRYRREIARLFV